MKRIQIYIGDILRCEFTTDIDEKNLDHLISLIDDYLQLIEIEFGDFATIHYQDVDTFRGGYTHANS